ncbi:MAG TPA: isoprenylcysteine carboxylmethyltransferase family protein [Candidatus Udaeobacter sp.]|jgi:protein-S-isoprenylcysteine O-methyltransferase Ste14|nr:isoprenylcysteine carboxylmethyltransferase family protein [Candidatus Udaeobacter sp.]
MFILFRTIVYASLFIGLLLIYLPSRLAPGFGRPTTIGGPQIIGAIVATAGAAVALWCILSFVRFGRGTPAPFDPPRQLVIRGPYRFIRNPMYVGATLALVGAAMFYRSLGLLGYAAGFLLVTHLFVLAYEEPTLRRSFGEEYEAYCRTVGRWWPRASTLLVCHCAV